MPRRIEPLEVESFHHIYNRGVAKQSIFLCDSDYYQVLECIKYYQYVDPPIRLAKLKDLKQEHQMELWRDLYLTGTKQVDIIAFVLMPNHWHFLLKQNIDNGISKFLSLTSNSYTKYFNTRYHRVGYLFQGPFKSVRVESEEQLLHLSRYIHLNPTVSNIVPIKELFKYKWSSFNDYLSPIPSFTSPQIVLNYFKEKDQYRDFVLNHFDYARQLEIVKHQLLDVED
jgi:putative transposase